MWSAHAAVVLAAAIEVLVPWYVYPTHWIPASYVWDDLAAANSVVPITAVLNPADGPGGPPNADYLVGLADLGAGGVTMLGYVYTSYGARPVADVKADIDVWSAQWASYGVSGIFLDEAASGAATLDYYQELYQYVHAAAWAGTVVVNPGVSADEGYLSRPAADIVLGFENTAAPWETYVPPPWQSGHEPRHFAALVHTVGGAAAMRQAADLAAARGFGFVFVTGDVMPNPWDTLPTFWTDEVAHLAALNGSVAAPDGPRREAWARTKGRFR